jgi:N-methylhydantoinase A
MLSGDDLSAQRLDATREELIATAAQALGEQPHEIRVRAELRYRGQSFELGVAAPPDAGPQEICVAFAQAHEQSYGYRDEQAQVELVTLRASVFGSAPEVKLAPGAGEAPKSQTRELIFAGRPVQTRCLLGELPPGTPIQGPMLCAMPETTLLVHEGWSGHVDEQGTIVLSTAADTYA